ncbi:peptide chain release factor 2 [candidate division WOR-3 bacterium]|nr:peptide chain release factor 2 [candidate division WOR-3 bacterium]
MKLKKLCELMGKLGGIFDVEKLQETLKRLQEESSREDFWNNRETAERVMRKMDEINELLSEWKKYNEEANYLKELEELGEEQDLIEHEALELEKKVKEFELKVLLSGENDRGDAVFTIHPGAGGTESCDWAEMLFRMYIRWIESRGFKYKVIDYQRGEEAGLKDVTLEIIGSYAYGYLKAESGIHRLVRISPFDSGARRHTSFASVFVYPLIEDDVEVELKEDDIILETFKSSGPGGQHVNKASTAVRLIHKPTNITVTCQSERSQMQNRRIAERILKSKLCQKKLEELEEEKKEIEGKKKDIGWGHQIRSYVLHPYQKIKDHRTGLEIGDVNRVLDGDLDPFINAYLRSEVRKNEE